MTENGHFDLLPQAKPALYSTKSIDHSTGLAPTRHDDVCLYHVCQRRTKDDLTSRLMVIGLLAILPHWDSVATACGKPFWNQPNVVIDLFWRRVAPWLARPREDSALQCARLFAWHLFIITLTEKTALSNVPSRRRTDYDRPQDRGQDAYKVACY